MTCKFGTVRTDATVISETSASCKVPTDFVQDANVAFEVSVDGSPASTSGTTFAVKLAGSSGSHLTAFGSLFYIALAFVLMTFSFVFF